jgi:A/G-specific adenine glycosylase
MSTSLHFTSTASEFRSLIDKEGLTAHDIILFRRVIEEYYNEYGRILPWRKTCNPYNILISEIMLQQTSVSRVLRKYDEFLTAFPNFLTLADAPLHALLEKWQGLGYNRRAIALRHIAQEVVSNYGGQLPSCPKTLQKLPGIGKYSASAIAAIAFNQPTVFIETNIRTVYIYFFFATKNVIADHEILPIVDATLNWDNPREWYYALFDYGAMLKKRKYCSAKSVQYKKQTPFKGSNREVRGKIIRLLLTRSPILEYEICEELREKPIQIKENLTTLQKEGFIIINENSIYIA